MRMLKALAFRFLGYPSNRLHFELLSCYSRAAGGFAIDRVLGLPIISGWRFFILRSQELSGDALSA